MLLKNIYEDKLLYSYSYLDKYINKYILEHTQRKNIYSSTYSDFRLNIK